MTRERAGDHQRYRFNDFVLDPAARELRRAGTLLTVSPKVFDCLTYLVTHRDRAVGRDELIAAVWGRTDVADVQLGHLMRKLRRTLSDNGEHQTVIHTIPRFGFRWVAQTDQAALAEVVAAYYEIEPKSVLAAAPAATVSDRRIGAPTTGATRAMRRRSIFAATGVLAASLGVVGFWFATSHHGEVKQNINSTVRSAIPKSGLELSTPALAVLPVVGDVGGDAEWMQLGLMDLIASRLRGAGLAVTPSTATVPFLQQRVDQNVLIDRARVATGADSIVLATIARSDSGWRLRLESHGTAGTRVAEAKAPDAIVAAREASDQLLELLGALRSRQPAAALSIAEVLQRAEAALLIDDFSGARHLLESAKPSLVELPEAQLLLARADAGGDHPERALPRLNRLISSLSAKDDGALRARALTVLGVAELGEPATAERHFTEAIELLVGVNETNYLGDAYNGRGVALRALGRYEDASADYARARLAFKLAGDSIGLARVDNNEAVMASWRGRPAEALPLLIRTAERFERIGALDKLVSPLVNVVSIYLDLLRPADALTVFQENAFRFDGIDNSADRHVWMAQGASALVANGKLREADELLNRLAPELNPEKEAILCLLVDIVRAELEFSRDQMAAAALPARRAINGLSADRLAVERARTWVMLVRTLHALHRNTDAGAELSRFSDWARQATNDVAKAYQALANAEKHIHDGDRVTGWVIYEQALRSMQQHGTPADIAEVAISYGAALIDAGDLPRASTTVGSLGHCTEHDYDCALLQLRLYRALGQKDAWRSALENVRALAGDRHVPASLERVPERTFDVAQP